MLPTVSPRKALLRCACPFPLSETEGEAATGGDIGQDRCCTAAYAGPVLIASPSSVNCLETKIICGAGLHSAQSRPTPGKPRKPGIFCGPPAKNSGIRPECSTPSRA